MTSASKTTGIYKDNWEYLSDELMRLELLILAINDEKRGSQDVYGATGLNQPGRDVEHLLGYLTTSYIENGQEEIGGRRFNDALVLLFQTIEEKKKGSAQAGVRLFLPLITQQFGLSPFEENCLILCLAPELDRKYGQLYAVLQDNINMVAPTVGLAMDLFCTSNKEKALARSAFLPESPLIKFHFIRIMDRGGENLTHRIMILDDRIADLIIGINGMDSALESLVLHSDPDEILPDVKMSRKINDQITSFINYHFNGKAFYERGLAFYLSGPPGVGKRSIALKTCRELKLPILQVDIRAVLKVSGTFKEMIWRIGREAALMGAVLILEEIDALSEERDKIELRLRALENTLETFSPLTFFLGRHAWNFPFRLRRLLQIDIEIPAPGEIERIELWENCLKQKHLNLDTGEISALARKFSFTPGQIIEVITLADDMARWRSQENGKITGSDLHAACRLSNNFRFGYMARKLPLKATWEDIILPTEQTTQLKEICNQAHYRHIVYSIWGFDRKLCLGRGLNVLFTGPPGTGKTLAATVIANELDLNLYRIDLSQVVSKYIGETEKNLEKIFTEAQSGNVILFFDEADALFGRRSEIRDAHDRYANIEVGYLLQRMEEYEGITILATNMRNNMDEAFVRRMHVIVDFPFPDENHRKSLWLKAFPSQSPIANSIDFDYLAYKFKITGGNIHNVALNAAFMAAASGKTIELTHIHQSLQREYKKMGGCLSKDVQ